MNTVPDRSSNIARPVLFAVTGILVGLGAGYLVFRGGRAAGSARCPKQKKADSAAGDPSSGPAGDSDSAGKRGDPAARAGGGGRGLSALYRAAQTRANFLAEENKRLKRILHYYKEDQKASQGQPIKWPDKVKERYRKDALRKAVEAAFKEAGVEGSVTDVDCREYPCVVAGEMKGSIGPEVFKKLRDTSAMAPYRKDSGMSTMSRSRRTQPDGTKKETNHFGVSFMERPKGGTPPEVRKRTGYRLRQLMEALSGP